MLQKPGGQKQEAPERIRSNLLRLGASGQLRSRRQFQRDGTQAAFCTDMRTAPREHMESAFQQRRHLPGLGPGELAATAKIKNGSLFRVMNHHGQNLNKRLSGEAVALIVKRYVRWLGYAVEDLAGHIACGPVLLRQQQRESRSGPS